MGTMRHGVHKPLEDEANQILKRDLERTTSVRDRSDILTTSKEALRRRREVHVATGTPDPSVRRGIYGREANSQSPHLNSRDGNLPAVRTEGHRRDGRGLADFVDRHLS